MPSNTDILIIVGLLALAILLLIALLIVSARRGRRQARDLRAMEDMLDDQRQELQATLSQQGMAQREEQLRMLQALSDGLQSTLARGDEAQTRYLNGVQQQVAQSAQTAEMRQLRLQQMTEQSLGRFEQRMQAVDASLDQKLSQNENRMEKLRLTMETGMRAMQEDNAKQLDAMRKTVDEKLHDTLDKRLNQSFSQVSERLEQVYKSLGEVHTLAVGVSDLKHVLGNVKTRGVWGEIQLGALLEQTLTSSQYAINVAVRPDTAERVEFAVCLPGKDDGAPVYLPIDSKFPQEDYTRLVRASESGDAQATEQARKALLTAVRVEGKRIASKYIEPPYTTDFAVMFLPLESLYAEIARSGDLLEQMQREQRVVIAGPSTLLALLNSLQMGFRTIAIEKRSAEVWRLLGAVKNDFGNFSSILERTQEKLKQATDSIDSAFVRTRSIERKLRRVVALDEPPVGALTGDGGE